MLRFYQAVAFSVAVVVSVPMASAANYTDPSGRFVVAVPEGWAAAKPDDATTLAVVLGKSSSTVTPYNGICLVLYIDLPATKSKTQAEINSIVDGQLTPEFWKSSLQSAGDKSFTVNSTGNREKDGRKINHAIFTAEAEENGKLSKAKGKMELHFIPGSFHSLLCMTELETYEAASADFEKILGSYEPRNGALVARAPSVGPSVLTMFASTSYDGVARVLSLDTPDLSAAGWASNAGSLVVDGNQPWEVCEGINFSGNCRTITAAHSLAAGQNMTVGSVRRLSGDTSLAATSSTAVRRLVRQAFLFNEQRH